MDSSPTPRSQELRKGRHSAPGIYYHLITVTRERRPVLARSEIASIIFNAFDWLETKGCIQWQCIMVMPDHVHAVVRLGDDQTLPQLMHSVKRFTAREINKHLGDVGSLWQRGYSDRGIRGDEGLNQTIRYCYTNPVRSGLVKLARDYPYWRCKFKME